jgi:hypothetical protein
VPHPHLTPPRLNSDQRPKSNLMLALADGLRRLSICWSTIAA